MSRNIASASSSSPDITSSDEEPPPIFTRSSSPATLRRSQTPRFAELDVRSRMPLRHDALPPSSFPPGPPQPDERTGLLAAAESAISYASLPKPHSFSRHNSSLGSMRIPRNGFSSRTSSPVGSRLTNGAGVGVSTPPAPSSFPPQDRVWYDQFTSTDWVHDNVADGIRLRQLRQRRDVRGRLLALFDGAQGWLLVAVIGFLTSWMAFFVDVTESAIFDLKEGFCTQSWFASRKTCCFGRESCSWRSWAELLAPQGIDRQWVDYAAYVFWAVTLAAASCVLTLLTKTVVPSSVPISTFDEDLAADPGSPDLLPRRRKTNAGLPQADMTSPPMVYYPAAGSGVAEVKVILSGFVVHGYLGLKTLVIKVLGLTLSVASGLSIGKEGPYVHIATAVGNIACRVFKKYHNDAKRREVLSASAASGVAVAFGAPIGGVLFSLEEVSYYFPPKTLFRTFFCCIAAALSLKFLNPYGTGKIVMFEVRYLSDWAVFELLIFVMLGVLGGAAGALFIKASKLWAQSFRRIPLIKQWPLLEVALVALVTGLLNFWNRYTKLPVSELLFELASPCEQRDDSRVGLCPNKDDILGLVRYLAAAFVVKSLLTIITFGIKLPAGIYVPSMVAGGLMGRIVGHLAQYFVVHFPSSPIFGSCASKRGVAYCINPGVYALVAAGATMCGVTRLTVTLAVILFELSGSLEYVLPFSLAVLFAKWTADAIEPLSIYDMLTDMNSYPFLDNKLQPIADLTLGDITPPPRRRHLIDVSYSPLVTAAQLRRMLDALLRGGELDGGLPVIRQGVLVGLIPAPDLEFALDNVPGAGGGGWGEEETLCLMVPDWGASASAPALGGVVGGRMFDLTGYVDPAPLALDIHSSINLVYQCFVKLGLRYMCVLRDGQYAGMVHKKAFVKFMKIQHRIME